MRNTRALFSLLIMSAAVLAVSDANAAAKCRDASGKFIKCATTSTATRCKNASGKFAKCGTPGAVAVQNAPTVSKPVAPGSAPTSIGKLKATAPSSGAASSKPHQ